MEWVAEKWGGRAHRRGELVVLGDDEHGRWFFGPKGGTVVSDGGAFTREHDAIFLLGDDWWCASWWRGHPEVAVYVDIALPPVWEDDRVVTVDLDLDVIKFVDGRVEVHDRDEFALHRERYGYPPSVIEAAERATVDVQELVTNGSAPFDDGTPRLWFTRVESARRDLEGSGR